MTKPTVIKIGALDMQVCVPQRWNDSQVTQFAESEYPCGTQHGWIIRRQGDKALVGCPERAKCSADPEFVHIMLDA